MKKDDENKKTMVEKFLGDIPFIGELSKELAKTETFSNRFKEIDKKIEWNLKKGKKKWGFEMNFQAEPLVKEEKKDISKVIVGEDYSYKKEGDKLILAVKVPQEEVILKIEGKVLLIASGNFEKKIRLPDYFRNIKKRNYEKETLFLVLTK